MHTCMQCILRYKVCLHIYIYKHTYIRKYIYKHTYIRKYIYKHTYIRKYIHKHTYIRKYIYKHTHIRKSTDFPGEFVSLQIKTYIRERILQIKTYIRERISRWIGFFFNNVEYMPLYLVLLHLYAYTQRDLFT